MSIVFSIIAALCICDLVALIAYAIKYLPTGLTEGICYPFWIPMHMLAGLIVRLIEIGLIVIGSIMFTKLNHTWHIWLPIGTGILTVVNSILYCTVSY